MAFNDSVITSMTFGSTKTSCSISYGLGPYFHEQLISDMKNAWYTMLVDESTTEKNLKQLDMHVPCWSINADSIVTRYFYICFF